MPSWTTIAIFTHLIASTLTQVYLLFFDGTVYTWWNWIIIIPIDLFLGEIWPLYWLIIRPLS